MKHFAYLPLLLLALGLPAAILRAQTNATKAATGNARSESAVHDAELRAILRRALANMPKQSVSAPAPHSLPKVSTATNEPASPSIRHATNRVVSPARSALPGVTSPTNRTRIVTHRPGRTATPRPPAIRTSPAATTNATVVTVPSGAAPGRSGPTNRTSVASTALPHLPATKPAATTAVSGRSGATPVNHRAAEQASAQGSGTNAPPVQPGLYPYPATSPAAAQEKMVAMEAMNFNNMPIEQFLQFYADFVGRTLLENTSKIPQQQTISLKFQSSMTRREAIQAMDTVLALNGVTMIPTGDKFITAVVEADALKQGAPFSTVGAEQLPEAAQFVTEMVQLKYADPKEVVDAITPFAKNPQGIVAVESTRVLVLRDYAANVKRMMEVIQKIDVESPVDMQPEVIPIKYALASDIAQVLGNLAPGGVASPVGSTGHTLNTSNSSGRLNQGNVLGQNNRNAFGGNQRTTPINSFQNRLQRIVNRAAAGGGGLQILGEVKIIPDERTNSLLVFADKNDLKMIKTIVDKLDVVLAQVLIEAIIMEVSLSDSQNYGISALQNDKSFGHNIHGFGASNNGQFLSNTATNLAAAVPSGFSYFTRFGSSWNVALQAIAQNSNIKVIQCPRIQTSHAVPAEFFVGDTVPYITGSTFGDYGGYGSRSTYSQLKVGVDLSVLPLINPEGLVVMQIHQQVESLGPSKIIDGNEVPTTTERDADATVAVRSGDTIILGGFIKNDSSKSTSGIPFLKDIPVLGTLFRSHNNDNKRTEMMVLIHPTVLPTPEAAALTATEQQQSMPAIAKASAEFEKDQRERRIQAAKGQ